ncbi:TPA: hypothetical protein G8W20_004830 [Salmonella enterica]|uniref:Uncharacterized protein n=1 Tax=Salmonella enterica TaxID=28901 RepID=A0A758JSY2_SALER|nr:hypothetical protein [Klebsiella oxytoca]HAG1192600.1 hypothetical protein [Salmonella enterica]
MTEKISLEEAVTLWLTSFEDKVAFFDSELYSFLYLVRETKSFKGYPIQRLRINSDLKRKFSEVSHYLISSGLAKKYNDKYFTIGNVAPDSLEVVCSLYNTGYISYLSAMRFYNLTNRIPKKIDFTTPTRPLWKKIQSQLLTENEINDSKLGSNIFTPPYPSERIKIENKTLNVHARSHLTEPKRKGVSVRVIEVGELFLEMLRHPDLCGGLQHVLEVYDEMAEALLEEIIVAVESLGTNMDKSRVGFIIDSFLDIKDPRIQHWKKTATARGGSRKFIPNEDYLGPISEEWCLSLNHSVFN